MKKHLLPVVGSLSLLALLTACQNAPEPVDQESTGEANASGTAVVTSETSSHGVKPIKVPVACKEPAPVADIWKLEPILVKKGEITSSMSKDEKEKVIKAYIARKNKQYEICLRGRKVQ